MHIIEISDPKQVQKDGEYLTWMEWITDASDAARAVKDHRAAGRFVARVSSWQRRPASSTVKPIQGSMRV
jgi:hypothetical protein